MYAEKNDEALVDLLKKNDPKALETIFHRYYKSLCQFCNLYTRDSEYAEEAIADLFIKLWDSRTEAEIVSLKSYLFTAAKNRSLNYVRKKKQTFYSLEEIDDQQQDFQYKNTPFTILSGRESRDHIMRAIDLLPVRQREVLLLSRIDNLENKRIAEMLGLSVRTVETTLYQSIKQLRVLLKAPRDYSSGS